MKNLTLLVFALLSLSSYAQDNAAYTKHLFIRNGDTLRCRILFPKDYNASKKYPLLVFLHGAGERGNDNEAQLMWGADLFIKNQSNGHPAIVIFPQCPKNDQWANYKRVMNGDKSEFKLDPNAPMKKPLELVNSLIDSMMASGKVDKKKIYLGGLSMGGFGTFELLSRRPETFAAAIPICGGADNETISNYRPNLPLWIFHGGSDPVVPVEFSRNVYAALKNSHPNVKYTEYPGVGHDSWKNAFAEPELLNWLFGKKLKGLKKS